MGSVAVFKVLIVPAVISLILFLTLTFVLAPLWRKTRERYGQYVPVHAIQSSTLSFGQSLRSGVSGLMERSIWRRNASQGVAIGSDHSDDGFASDDGEELGQVNQNTRQAIAEDARRSSPESTGRLSRDLEEGFRDDSDDEDNGRRAR
ncbi:hypothetical protein VDGD_08377 [Verticillium dahliae]|nr:hypothetical protein VDGD_08377 [Verticillium dahliae]